MAAILSFVMKMMTNTTTFLYFPVSTAGWELSPITEGQNMNII